MAERSLFNDRADDRPSVAGALLLHPDRKILLHHRDDKPWISNPGKWALFGGHLDPGETPRMALDRELEEELGLRITRAEEFCVLHGKSLQYYMYIVPIEAEVGELVLGEGQGMAYFVPEDALASLDLSPSGRAVIAMWLAYEQYLESEVDGSQIGSSI